MVFTHKAGVRFPVGEIVVGPDVKMESMNASLAQSVEHQTFNLRVAGSSPVGGIFFL